MASVDVIILNYNGHHFLGPCLRALRAQTYRDFEVLVVDNKSPDDSLALLQRDFPEVRVLALPDNGGFCVGNNKGIRDTSAPMVALLNNDTEVSSAWLESLVATLEAHPEAGFCASRMVRHADPAVVDTAGDVYYLSAGVAAKRGTGEPASRYEEPGEVFGACAGAALYRRAMLDRIGLLDEDLGSMNEDVDLSFRAQLRGYRCRYVPAAVVRHHVGGSFNKVKGTAVRLARRNMLEVLLKNMPSSLLLRHGASILAYYLLGDLRTALRGHAGPVARARLENLRRLPATLRKRRAIQREATVPPHELAGRMSAGRWSARLGGGGTPVNAS